MSLIQVQGQAADSGRQISPDLTTNFPSNNPFRNRAVSPASSLPSPVTSSFGNFPSTAPERPTSRNPFLDQSEKKGLATVQVRATSPEQGTSAMAGRKSPSKPALTGHAVELFDNLTLNDNTPQGQPPPYTNRPPRAETIPMRSENLPPRTRNGLSGHLPSRSQEEGHLRPRTGTKPRGKELDIFADPPSPEQQKTRRMRRNSDSSIASRIMSPEDEKKRKERHRREREARHRERDGKGRHAPTSSKSKKSNKQLDIIDSLDVTSIFGTGVFHHDGPFDACNPHRNRGGTRRAPMQAFAKDSLNMAIGGSGPVNKDLNFAQFHGRGDEGFTDYSTSGQQRTRPLGEPANFEPYAMTGVPARVAPGNGGVIDRASSFNPTVQVEKIHGEESMGLGTTTHLEGTPAPRAAIVRRESENDRIPGTGNAGGLGRKRSLAQKIRGISNANHGDRGFKPSGRITSPEGVYERTTTPTGLGEAPGAGGMAKIKETNPFFNNRDDDYEKKGQKIQDAEQRLNRKDSIGGDEDQINVRSRAMSSPKRTINGLMLERRITNDGPTAGSGDANGGSGGGGGFLSRVKSLKGGKRSRPERRE